ncbi:MAG: acyltransferase [Verrucomicrobiota bacterium]
MTGIVTVYSHEIDVVKATAIFGVVIIHVPPIGHFNPVASEVLSVLQGVFEWAVFGFFFASGFLTKPESFISRERFLGFLKRRAARLLVPCLLFSVIYKFSMWGLWKRGFVQSIDLPLPESTKGWVDFMIVPASPQFYFLPVLFAIQVCCFPLFGSFGACLRVGLALVLVGVGGTLWGVREGFCSLHGPEWSIMPLYGASYLTGVVFKDFRLGRWELATLALLFSSLTLLAWMKVEWLRLGHLLVAPILYGLFYEAGKYDLGARVLRYASRLGLRSGAVYVWHAPILISACTVLVVGSFGGGVLSLLLVVSATVILAALCGEATKRFSLLKPLRF